MLIFFRALVSTMLYFFATSTAWAASDQMPGLMEQMRTISATINTGLINTALITASAALSLQWIATHWKEIFTGELSSILAKSVGVISWFGFTVWLLQNQNLMSSGFDAYVKLAGDVSGVGNSGLDAGDIMAQGVMLMAKLNLAFSKAMGFTINPAQIADNMFYAAMLTIANFFTFICFLMISLALFVAQAEFWMMFAVAPLAFGLIPLSAFRDQGIAPIKGLMSLGLRIIILAVIVKVTNSLTEILTGLFATDLPKDQFFTPIWMYLAGMATCAVMSISAGKIASAIASGSSSFSGADAIKGGMQMAAATAPVAAVAALATRGAVGGASAVLGAATKGIANAAPALGKALGEFMGRSNLGVSGGGGSSGGGPLIGGAFPQDPSKQAAQQFASMDKPSGSARSAGIDGDGSAGRSDSLEKGNGLGYLENAGKVFGNAAEAMSQDNHAVTTSISTRGE